MSDKEHFWIPKLKEQLAEKQISRREFVRDLGLGAVRLLTNNPRKFVGLQGYGLSVSETLPLEIPASEHTRRYLTTKKEKLGHLLSSV